MRRLPWTLGTSTSRSGAPASGQIGVGAGIGALREEEGLAESGGPGGTHGQILERGILGVDALGTGNGADVADAVLIQRDGAAVEGECLGREVDDGAEDAVEIERGGDLAAHLRDECELARRLLCFALTDGKTIGAADGRAGGGGQSAERVPLDRTEIALRGT